jgi:C1A family cysteine protease
MSIAEEKLCLKASFFVIPSNYSLKKPTIMAIRMEKDDPQDQRRPSNPNRGRSGGGSNIGRLLPFILMFVFRKPKLLIPILIIGAVWYFFLGGNQMFSSGVDTAPEGDLSEFSFGATLNEEQYDKAEVFEPLAYSSSQNRLPSQVSLIQYAPQRAHQGRQGSCVGWASSYAARTILEAQATGKPANQVRFSPSFLYNQIALPNCQGAYMRDAMETMHEVGLLPFSEYPYDERSCSNLPSTAERRQASQFRIKGYNRLTKGANNYSPDMMGIKQHLAQGSPTVIGMQVGGTFMHQMRGKDVWQPTSRDKSLYGFSGHAMCVIGYDDTKYGGAFQIMNSWGESWGNNGIAWVRYPDFQYFVKEAYGLYPMGKSEKYDPNKLAVKFGLVDNATQNLIPLYDTGNRVFRSRSPLQKGQKFKIAVTNSVECYIYVFGEEANGSSSVLFPYTSKHSPYCGITGTRLFPKDYSMTPDEVGNRDRIAVIVSKEELNFEEVNRLINNSNQSSYAAKVQDVLQSILIPGVQFEVNEAVAFSTDTKGKQAVATVIEIDKR